MRIAPEGVPFAIAAAVIGAALGAALSMGLGLAVGWTIGLAALPLLFVLFFFRDPRRHGPAQPHLAISPADGRVTDVTDVEDDQLGGPGRRIGIFLSVFNVHVQRAPLDGQVVARRYKQGRFHAAWSPVAGTDNEQSTLTLATDAGPVVVRQIAGWVARRIVTDPDEGDVVRQRDRIGLIRFGSRVELTVPVDWTVTCTRGQSVRAGVTALARAPVPEPPSSTGETPS